MPGVHESNGSDTTSASDGIGTPGQRVRWKRDAEEADRINLEQQERDRVYLANKAVRERDLDDAVKKNMERISPAPPNTVSDIRARRYLADIEARDEICPTCLRGEERTIRRVRGYQAWLTDMPKSHPCLNCKRVSNRTEEILSRGDV